MKLYALLLIVFISFTPHLQAAKNKKAITLKPLSKLNITKIFKRDRFARALIYLDVEGSAPSIKIHKLNTNIDELDEIPFDEDLSSRFIRTSWTLPLKGLEKGIYSIALKPGVYQISQVNAPYYNFPFKLQTEDDPRWRFRVYPDSFSYIGHLKIYKERDAESVESYFLDRFYSDQEEINSVIAKLPQPIEVTHGVQTHTRFELDNGGEK